MTTQDTQTCQRGHSESKDPAGDQMVSDVLTAIEVGIDTAQCLQARSAGLTHDQTIWAIQQNWAPWTSLDLHIRALRAGATASELREVVNALSVSVREYHGEGKAAEIYIKSREGGMTHEEFRYYEGIARNTGELQRLIQSAVISEIEHSRLIAFHRAGARFPDRIAATLNQGATDADIFEVLAHGAQFGLYTHALQVGITHSEYLAVAKTNPAALTAYVDNRTQHKPRTKARHRLPR
jgi:alkylhydroperoxidase/carboxymuconolactone decarboxylase family protein YurZ